MSNEPKNRDLFIPFSAAAKAAGVSQKRIRNWLDNADVYLDAEEFRSDPAKHRRFSRLDVARLGLVARLTTLGFSAERASSQVEDCLHSALWVKGGRKTDEKQVIADHDRTEWDIPELAFRTLLKHQKKIVERVGDRRFLKPDSITLGNVEKIFKTPESEILDALRDAVLVVEVIGYDIEEYFGPSNSDQPNYLFLVRAKDENPMKAGWNLGTFKSGGATDTRIVIEVWKMMQDQDEALRAVTEEQ